MKLIVKPQHERARCFKHIVPAMQFAEAARARQGPKPGLVTVVILDSYWPHDVATYGKNAKGQFVWTWIQT